MKNLVAFPPNYKDILAVFPAIAGPSMWWKEYLTSKDFRMSQEVQAYRAQYKFALTNDSRQVCRALLKRISNDLSGPIYGNLCNFETAKHLISQK